MPLKDFEWQDIGVRRWLGVVSGCLAIMVAGSIFSFNAYADDLEDHYNITQTQLELLASFHMIGSGIGYPVGIFFETVGPAYTFLTGTILGAGANLLMMVAAYSRDFHRDNITLMYIYMFLSAICYLMFYLIPVAIIISNFPGTQRGTIMGLTGAAWFIGNGFVSLIYVVAFSPSDFGGFFLTLALMVLIAGVLCTIFLHYHPQEIYERLTEEKEHSTDEKKEASNKEIAENKPLLASQKSDVNVDEQSPEFEIYWTLDFQLIGWTFVCLSTTQIVLINNITTIAESIREDDLGTGLTIAGPILAGIVKIVSGIFSDRTLDKFPRSFFLPFLALMESIAFTVSIFAGDIDAIFATTAIIMYIANGHIFIIIPTIISEVFGLKHFSRNFGFWILLMSIMTLGYHVILGTVYDNNINDHVNEICFGNDCYTVIYSLCAVTCVIGTVTSSIFTYRELQRRSQPPKDELPQDES